MAGGEIQSRNDDPRRKPRGTRLKGDALSFPQACLTQWHAMATTERCPPKKAEAHFGVSAPSQIKWHSGRTPRPPGAFGVSATASTALGRMQCGTGRGGALMPSPLSTSPANAPGCTQRREGDSPSFFAATADRCGRVAHTPIATSRRYRRGSMWAGRPHSYGGQQLRIGEDQCGRVAHTPSFQSPIPK